ncbi:aminodeoxychorismate synthase component I [Salinisphaera aquimarina]|uniref:Aminodeoxychorismate synthase component I n=1 Tax=Salinisphaera aquimarina TaxID=2094031 RepID=A0ABV7ER89_9GAMM
MQYRDDGDLCIADVALSAPPDLLSLAYRNPERYPFLLESSAGAVMAQRGEGANHSRYDLLLAFPGKALEIGDRPFGSSFFDTLDAYAATEKRTAVPGLPFVGGWFIYLAYEMAARVEPTLDLPRASDAVLPEALAVRCPAAIIHDRQESRLHVICEANDRERLELMLGDLDAASPTPDARPLTADWQAPCTDGYLRNVAAARELIHAGDVFQVNLSHAWHGYLANPVPPAGVYAALRAANPAPFSGLIQWRAGALVCSSPERLVQIEDGVAQTRPIAGTRARTPGTDDDMTRELLAHPKERAEHIMLIDLERNDLGRICEPGSIQVDELMTSESYAHVHHIVSNVRGRLAPGVGPGRALAAVFPGGTITGCPKVRCMQIIAELEQDGRGAYTGSIGYLSRCGRLDSNIVIRSLSQRKNTLTLRTGAGVVADSVPDNELEETHVKARGVLRSFVNRQGNAYG